MASVPNQKPVRAVARDSSAQRHFKGNILGEIKYEISIRACIFRGFCGLRKQKVALYVPTTFNFGSAVIFFFSEPFAGWAFGADGRKRMTNPRA